MNNDIINIARNVKKRIEEVNEFNAELKESLKDEKYMREYIAEAIRLYSEDGSIPLLVYTLEPVRAACHNER